MKAFLKGCSEEINFETKEIKHFLTFEREDGRVFSLPSSQEATNQLVAFLSDPPAPEQVPGEESLEIRNIGTPSQELEGATEFGGDVDESDLGNLQPEQEADARPSFEVHDPNENPQNEEEVPSL